MKLALIAIATLAVVFIAIEVVGRVIYHRRRRRSASLAPDQQRREQERQYKNHVYRG